MTFSRISGTLIERAADTAVIDAGGLGYAIVLPPCVAEKIPAAMGSPVTLEVYAVVNIDGNAGRFTYYGFTNAIEREFFEALISVASIGPRSAARAFSQPMSSIARAIDRGDHA
ncbi:MAG TPA: OB-fold domain-containing protein, partial [Candidatus Tumulicola sp.]|nr:OB-fold domain-containing protein [Candidatus Tumulicola sp.]